MRGNKDDVGCVGMGVLWGFGGLESGAFLGFFAVVAKVLNLFFSQSVFHFISSKASDFSHFSKSEALSHCAVRGLYGDR